MSGPAQLQRVFSHPQKRRTGLVRLWHALRYSLRGLRAAWLEKAFRQEVLAACVLLPAAVGLGRSWLETAMLCAVVVVVLVVELLNSAIEVAIDRIGLEWHPLSEKAKDLASAAVFLSILMCCAIWASAVWRWLD